MRKKLLVASIATFVSIVSSGAFMFAQDSVAACVGGC
jgi:hypothetical protein